MKLALLFAGMLSLLAGPLSAMAAADAPRAVVIFDHPERFTDVKDRSYPTDKGREGILATLRDFLVHQAAYQVPAGYQLTLTFTDIDLAGEFEPWRGPQFGDVRIIKPIYPPDFKFTYVLTDIAGRVVRQGQENIRDLGFDLRSTLDNQDPLRYEKSILADWMRSRMREVRTTRS
jgi:hypothetical protein